MAAVKDGAHDFRQRVKIRKESYNKQRWKMQRFKFRQPNDTHQVNLTNLNDYHLYLKENPGIDTSPLLLYGTLPSSPIIPAAYRMCGRVRHSVTATPKLNTGMMTDDTLSLGPCNNSPASSPFTPLGFNYDLYYPISPEPTSRPSQCSTFGICCKFNLKHFFALS